MYGVLDQMIVLKPKYLYVDAVEVIRPSTSNLTSLYDQISNSTVTAAYQHGEQLTLIGFFKQKLNLLHLNLVFSASY